MGVLEAIFWFLVTVTILVIAGTWVVMIVAGMIHSEVPSLAQAIPAWSFRESFFVSLGLTVLGSFFQSFTGTRS